MFMASLASACSTDKVSLVERTLVDNRQWKNASLAADPLQGEQPAVVDCSVAGWFVEYDILEVDTGQCNYAWIEHPALVDVPPGSTVTTTLVHYDLLADAEAEAHFAILFGDDMQWETRVPIPSVANVIDVTWTSTRALRAGEPVRVHLHNHGQNFWALGALNARVPSR